MRDDSNSPFANYQLLRLLGKGEIGQVYLGEHVSTQRQGAVKVLFPLPQDRFFPEDVTGAVCLHHPHIICVREAGVEQSTSTPFIVMDYAPGGDLRQRHPRGSRVPLPLVLEYMKQVAAALQYAHDQHWAHGDVKPEHIVVGSNQELLLIDFGVQCDPPGNHPSPPNGICSHRQHQKQTGGTPVYMAPERLKGAGPKSDQYALGILVYEWLSGAPPFTGFSFEVYKQHAETPLPPLPKDIPMLSRQLEQVVMKAVEKDSQTRFATVQDFASAFEHACPFPNISCQDVDPLS